MPITFINKKKLAILICSTIVRDQCNPTPSIPLIIIKVSLKASSREMRNSSSCFEQNSRAKRNAETESAWQLDGVWMRLPEMPKAGSVKT